MTIFPPNTAQRLADQAVTITHGGVNVQLPELAVRTTIGDADPAQVTRDTRLELAALLREVAERLER